MAQEALMNHAPKYAVGESRMTSIGERELSIDQDLEESAPSQTKAKWLKCTLQSIDFIH